MFSSFLKILTELNSARLHVASWGTLDGAGKVKAACMIIGAVANATILVCKIVEKYKKGK